MRPADGAADTAVRALRRATLGRSLRANVRWAVRAVGWGSIVYLVFWAVVLAIAALQSIVPLAPPIAAALTRWAVPGASAVLALALLQAARTQVTPLWLDRRDLTHLAAGAARAATVLAWPAWRAALPALVSGLVVGGALALVVPRLLGRPATAAVLLLPTLALLLPLLRWRAALAAGRDAIAWTIALAGAVAAMLTAGCTAAGVTGCSLAAGAPAAAALGALTPATGFGLALGMIVLTLALARRTGLARLQALPPVVMRQSELLAELRAIATLRGLSAITASAPDPGARFAEARARDALRGRRSAFAPRWRPRVPRRGGATSAFAWLALVRAWRGSPLALLALPPLVVGVALTTGVNGPFGGAALVPGLALAWTAAVLHPGRAGWEGFSVDGRARTLAHLLLVGSLTMTATIGADVVRALLGLAPATEGWLLLPLGLGAAALVDTIGARAADPRALGVWLLAGLLVTVPAALLGWFAVDAAIAAPLAAWAWLLLAWVRVVMAPRYV